MGSLLVPFILIIWRYTFYWINIFQHSPPSWWIDIVHSQFGNYHLKFRITQSFSQHINKLWGDEHIYHTNHITTQFFIDKVLVNFNMFGSIIFYWIVCYTNCWIFIALESHRLFLFNFQVFQDIFSHKSLFILWVIARNSDSALDRIIIFYFFLLYVTKFLLRKIQ